MTRPPRSVVVVGAGLAGARTVQALRGQGFDGHLTVLGAEGIGPYDRPPLSKDLFTRTEPVWLRDDLGTDLDVADDVRLADPATGLTVEPGRVTVRTTGAPVTADAVVLATGSHAVLPTGWDEALTLHTAADADRLRGALTAGSRLVIIGAGWIGGEVATVATAAGVDVTVIEAATAPLTTALGADVGRLTVPWYEATGVRLLTAATVVRVAHDRVALADGRVLPADVVLAAVGARPSTGWLGPVIPRRPDGSLTVDEGCRVLTDAGPLPHVVGVGDVAVRRSPRHGWVTGGHWDAALRTPEIAVRSLLHPSPDDGDGLPQDPAPYVFSTQLGHELAVYGQPGPGDDVVLRGDPAAGHAGALWFTPGGDELTAVLVVDRPREVAAARKLFTGPTLPRVDREAAADPTARLTAARSAS